MMVTGLAGMTLSARALFLRSAHQSGNARAPFKLLPPNRVSILFLQLFWAVFGLRGIVGLRDRASSCI
jgi:hypothetical protein